MGKNLIQQARGKGGPRYRSPSFRFIGQITLHPQLSEVITGVVQDIMDCPGHSAPLMNVVYPDGKNALMVAPEGIHVGAKIENNGSTVERGNVMHLKSIPPGTPIYNIESVPGDGGKFCRTSGGFARIIGPGVNGVQVQLPSKKERVFHEECRATIGIIAGGGRPEKPFLKAGRKHFQMKAKNKLYPRSSACKQNAVDHPFGNKRSSRKAKQRACGHFAPPGRKVGKLWPSRTGRKK